MKKVLAVAVILLFLGVGVQPALANEVSNTVSDVDEDCLECQPVNRIDILKVKLLMIRVEAFTNVILSRFGHIPEIREKCEEISDRITNFQEMYNDLKLGSLNWDFPIICAFLESNYKSLGNFSVFIYEISDIFDPNGGIYVILVLMYYSVASLCVIIYMYFAEPLNCEWTQLV